jgi:hypothetical protein
MKQLDKDRTNFNPYSSQPLDARREPLSSSRLLALLVLVVVSVIVSIILLTGG